MPASRRNKESQKFQYQLQTTRVSFFIIIATTFESNS